MYNIEMQKQELLEKKKKKEEEEQKELLAKRQNERDMAKAKENMEKFVQEKLDQQRLEARETMETCRIVRNMEEACNNDNAKEFQEQVTSLLGKYQSK